MAEFEETDQERLLRDKIKRMKPFDFWTYMRTANLPEDATHLKIHEEMDAYGNKKH